MSLLEQVSLGVTALAAVTTLFIGVRNQLVFTVRIAFVDDTKLLNSGAYDALPSYDAMIYNPRYWLLWTKKQWLERV